MFQRSNTSAFRSYRRPVRRPQAPTNSLNAAALTIQRRARGYLTRRRLATTRLPSLMRRMSLTRRRRPFHTSTSRRR